MNTCDNVKCRVKGHGCTEVSTHNDCVGPWIKGRRTGVHGATGDVYEAWPEACDGSEDPEKKKRYVIKHIPFVPDDDSDLVLYKKDIIKQVTNEVTIQIRAAEAGLAVPVTELLLDDRAALIIMPRLERTAQEVLGTLSYERNEVGFCGVSSVLLGLIDALHQLGIVHGDPNLNNFMCDSAQRWYLIDFDRSRYISDKDSSSQVYDKALLSRHCDTLWKKWQRI